MDDSSDEELNNDEEIIDLSPLWRDRPFLSNTTSDDETERISGNDNASASVIEFAPVSTLESIEDGATTEQNQINNMFTISLLRPSFSFAAWNERINNMFQDQTLPVLFLIDSLSDRNPRHVNGLRSSPRGRTRGRNIFTPSRYAANNASIRSQNTMAGVGNLPELFSREIIPQLLPRRVRQLRNTRPLIRGRYDVSPPRYLINSTAQSSSNIQNNVMAHRRSSLSFDDGSNVMRDPRRVRELRSSSRGATRSFRGQNINSSNGFGYNNNSGQLSPQTTPENRLSMPFREVQNNINEDETFPVLFPRERDSQLLPSRGIELSNTSPLVGGQNNVSSPRFLTISTNPYVRATWEEIPRNTTAEIAICDEMVTHRRSSAAVTETLSSRIMPDIIYWDESRANRRFSLLFEGVFTSTMRSPRADLNELMENRRFSLSFELPFTSTMRSPSRDNEQRISLRGIHRRSRGRILTSTPRGEVRRLSFSLEMRELSFMIDPPPISEDNRSVNDTIHARGAVLAKDRLKKGRVPPGKPGDSKKKDPKPKRRGK